MTASSSRGQLVAVWGTFALTLGGLLAVTAAFAGPLDDPDPAHQRPGFLDAFDLPQPAPQIDKGHPAIDTRTVLFFERADRLEDLCSALDGSDLANSATIAVVVAGEAPSDARCRAARTVVSDPAGGLARAYGMRSPASGGPPVGYAVVDRLGQLRYRTLDPSVPTELGEVRTIVDATP